MHLVTCRDGNESILGTQKMSCCLSVMVSMTGDCTAYFEVRGEEGKKKKGTLKTIQETLPSVCNEVAKFFSGQCGQFMQKITQQDIFYQVYEVREFQASQHIQYYGSGLYKWPNVVVLLECLQCDVFDAAYWNVAFIVTMQM